MALNLPDQEICEKYLNGLSTIKLAKEYNCDPSTIMKRLKDNKIKIRSQSESSKGRQAGKNSFRYIKLPIEEICEKYLNGKSAMKLAIEYKCSEPTIFRRLRDNNIKIKLSSDYNGKTHTLYGKKRSFLERQHMSAGCQGILYDEWEEFACKQLYCPDFNKECKESNRDKYDRCCFLTGLPEEENITSTGKQKKLAVHHYDMDKGQGCNGKKWKLVPICLKWHGKIHNKLWEGRIIWLLDNVWNNKNYKW